MSWLSLGHRGRKWPPGGGPHKPQQRLPIPTPQSGDHQESCFPFSPSSPTLPLPLPQPSLSSPPPQPPSQPSVGVPLLSDCLKELPAPGAGPQNKKTTIGKHRKGEKPQNSGLPLSTNNQGSRQGARLCSASKPGVLLCLGQSFSSPFQFDFPVPKDPC